MHTLIVPTQQPHKLTDASTKTQKRLVFFLEYTVFAKLRRFAFDHELSQADVMRAALSEYLDRQEKERAA